MITLSSCDQATSPTLSRSHSESPEINNQQEPVTEITDSSVSGEPSETEPPQPPVTNQATEKQVSVLPSSSLPQQDKMATDLIGPDGRIYPNFAWAGLPKDVTPPTQIFKLNDFSKQGDLRGKYIDDALQRALDAAIEAGGGIIEFHSGTFFLARPVLISHDNIVLRGVGRGSRWQTTQIEFRYQPPMNGVDIIFPRDGDKVHPEANILITADPGIYEEFWTEGPNHQMLSKDESRRLNRLAIYLNDELLREKDTIKESHGAPQCSLSPWVHHLWKADLQDGQEVEIKAVAEWKDGSKDEKTIKVTVDASLPNRYRTQAQYAAFTFAAPGRPPEERFVEERITSDLKRGETWLPVMNITGYQIGDYVRIRGNKPKLDAENRSNYLTHHTRIVEINTAEKSLHIEQPLRLDLPLSCEAKVRRIEPLRNCGIEHMTIRQTKTTWCHGIFFDNTWGCWVKNVEYVDVGRNPVTFQWSKHGLIQNVLLNGGRYPNSGGSSNYFGFADHAQDSLAENITTVRLRHSPNFQGTTNGCVIRNSTFENSDLQWHAFYPYENLIENCRVFSSPGSGSYGYAAYVVKPGGQHGIAGPRNVVWGNKLIATHKSGIVMGGQTDGWMWMYNQVTCRSIYKGLFAGVVLRDKTTNTLFHGNHFSVAGDYNAIATEGEAGAGNRFTDNVFHQTSRDQFYAGDWPIEASENIFTMDGDQATPWFAPKSLYLWQRASVGLLNP